MKKEEKKEKKEQSKLKKAIKIVLFIANTILIISLIWSIKDIVPETFRLLDETNGDFMKVMITILKEYAL